MAGRKNQFNLSDKQIEAAAKTGREKTQKAYAEKADIIAKGYPTSSKKTGAIGSSNTGKKNQFSGKRTTGDGATRVDQVMAAAINSTLSAFQKLAADNTSSTGSLSMGESARAAINEAKTAKKEGRQVRPGQAQRKAEQDKIKSFNDGWAGDFKQKLLEGAQKSAESAYESERHAKEGLGKFGQGVVDFGIAGAQFAGDALLNAVAPGAGLAAMAGRAYGSASLDAQQRGLSEGEQQISGLKSAAIEMLTEKLFGSVSKVAYGKGIIRNESLVNSLVNRLAKTDRGRTALKVLVGANEEGMEEVLSDILNPIADRILKLDDGKGDWSDLADDFDTQQMLEDYIIGGALGLVGAGTNVVSGQYRAENAQQRAYEEYQRQLVNAGLATEQGGDAQLTAEKYKNILDQSTQRGKRNLSDKETANLERLMTIGTDTQTVRDMLAQSGVLVDDNTAQAAALAASGQKLSSTQNAAIGNAAVQNAINQMAGNGVVDNIRRTAANEYSKPIVINSMARQYEVAPEVVERIYNLNPTAPQAFETAFNAVYQMGQQGTDKAVLGKVPVLSTAQANIAYQMGADSVMSTETTAPVTNNNTQEVNDNGVRIHNVAERINGQNTEGQIRGVETGTGENVAGGSQKEQGGAGAAQIKAGEKVSYKGKQQKGVYYAAEDTEDMKKGRKLAESYGYKVTYFVGGNIRYAGGEFRGVVDTAKKTVMVRADHPDYTAEQIMRHEMGHAAFENGDLSIDEAREMLLDEFTADEINELIEIYNSEYSGILSAEEAFEEICCDALGRMNIFEGTDLNSESYGKAQNTVRKYAADKTGSKGRAPPKNRGRAGGGSIQNSRSAVKKKFSMEAPIEEKKNLIALHNLNETKLLKTLKLGGFPMPSIAITKSDIPHTNFGNITIVFGKETIDPEFDRRNTVYSADAWTPLVPRVEYEANPKAEKRIRDKYYELLRKYGNDFAMPLYESANYLSDTLTKNGGVEGMVEKFADDTRMMQVYLADTGKTPIEAVKTETVTRIADNQIEEYDALINTLGADVLNEMTAKSNQSPLAARKEWFAKHGEDLKSAFEQYLIKTGIDAYTAKSVVGDMKPASLLKEAVAARYYLNNGAETRRIEVDTDATDKAIKAAVNSDEYMKWLKDLYGNSVKDSGFYNNKDYYTPSGNMRSFKATHFPNTLDGIVKAMTSQGDGNSRNVMGFHGTKSLRAATAERFKSIEDMHKLEGRLKHLTEEEAAEINDALNSRLSELMHNVYELAPHDSSSYEFIELDNLGEIFIEAAELKYKSPANVKSLFKKYNYPLTDKMANDIVALLYDINNMPVNIFEAKPERAVGFDEIRKVIIPDTSSDTLRVALKDAGINNVEEYKAGDDAARMKIANDVPDAHFSREPERLNELRRQNERKLAQATAEDAVNENERGLIRDYQKQYSKVEDIREKLSAAQQTLTEAEDSGADYDTTTKAKNRFTLLSKQYAREHRKLESYANMKALQNVLARVDERLGNDLPEGMGAASANFTGEETVGERWVTEAQGKGDSALHPISKEQEANLAEQQQRAPQEIPKEDLNGKLTSKHVSTIANSGMTPAEFSDALREDAALGKFSHIAYSDEEALKKANRTIEIDGWEQALANYKAEINSGRVSKDNTVMGIALYNNAVNSGDYATAMDIASLMVKNSTNTAQSLQAMRILNKLSPECRLYLAAKSIENIEEDLNERYKDNKADIHVDKILYDEYAKALRQGDEDGIKTAWENIEQSVAQQINATWYEKFNNFRYLAMLGNPRTHVRNIVGNAFFVPVRAVKNTIAYGLENIADAKINGGIERSKAILNSSNAADAALVKYAMSDYEAVQEVILSGGKYVDTFQGIDKHRTIYKTKILEAARKGNSAALDAEDAWFCKPAYANALAKWYKANGITAEQLNTGKVPEETIIKAQTTAIKEAQKATYRDTNWFSAQVSRLGKVDNKVAAMLIEGVLPFKKTPANILARAVEYSPVGLIKSLALDTKKVKAYVNGDIENGMSPAEFIDDISAGLTGSALMGLGILLASWGVLSGGDDDDEKQNYFDELSGKQNYALSIGGMSITLDWLAPESMPLFVGVELFNSLSSKNEDKGFLQNLMSSVMSLSTPMFEMSMLQSVNDLFDNLAYIKQGQGTFKIVSSMAANYISQYFPTLFGQGERVFGETQRETTYVDRNSAVGSELQYMWGKIANKIPFYDFSQIPYIDAWGRTEETGNLFERMLNNFVNPAYVKKERPTEIDGELERLYDLGETSVYPSRAKTNTKINGEYLTADEYVKYATTKGQTSYELAQGVINSAAYSGAADPEKAYMLKYVYSYADHIAKYEVNNDYSLAKWEMAAYKSANPMQAIIDHAREYYNPNKEN